jgi:hypothetical protein
MSAVARKTVRRKAAPPAESSVYDGARLLGEIKPRGRTFTARLASGRRLGSFANERLAQKAICAGARAERASSPQVFGAVSSSKQIQGRTE